MTNTIKPTVGRIVLYKLGVNDLEAAVASLPNARGIVNPDTGKIERVEWPGNSLLAGDELPAMIVRPWGDECVNLVVHLDGPGSLWLTSRTYGENQQQWRWPLVAPKAS